jgi:hypothetical protein
MSKSPNWISSGIVNFQRFVVFLRMQSEAARTSQFCKTPRLLNYIVNQMWRSADINDCTGHGENSTTTGLELSFHPIQQVGESPDQKRNPLMRDQFNLQPFVGIATWPCAAIVGLLFASTTYAADNGCFFGRTCLSQITCREAVSEPWIVSPEPWLDDCQITQHYAAALRGKEDRLIPIGAGAFHWFQKDLQGSNSGYGIPGMRGTFFWYLTADPKTVLSNGCTMGAHTNIRLREQDRFRSFYDGQVWSYESYAYITIPEFGTLK